MSEPPAIAQTATPPLGLFDRDVFARIPTPLGIAHDAAATWISVNPLLASLLGVDPEANASLSTSTPDAPGYAVYRSGQLLSADEFPLQQAARTNAPVSGWEGEIQRRDGTRVLLIGEAVPLHNADGTVRGSVGVFRDVSDPRHGDADRRQVEAHLHDLANSMSDAFSAVDREWRVRLVNHRFAQMAGLRAEDIVGRVIWDVFPEAARGRIYESAQRAMAGGAPVIVEDYYGPLNLWFETRLYPNRDGLTAFTTDITERKLLEQRRDEVLAEEQQARRSAEAAIELKEQYLSAALRLAAIVEWSEDAVIGKDANGIVTSWNRAAERMFGYLAGEIVGQSIRAIIPPDREAEEDGMMQRIRAGDQADRIETVRIHKDGHRIDVSLTVSAIRLPDGTIVGTSKIVRDITERKRAEASARRAQERAMFLARAASALSEGRDCQETLLRLVDVAVPEMADWCAASVVGEDGAIACVGLAHADPPEGAAVRRMMEHEADTFSWGPASVIRMGRSVMMSRVGEQAGVEGLRAAGVRSYVSVPLLAHGGPLGALTFATSSPDRGYDEADLQFFEDLGARAALAVDNLRAYEQLESANQLKDEFLATLSHELRTPLNAILGYARMLRSGMVDGEKQLQAIAILERNATSLTQIVNDVLDVSRIISGKLRLNVKLVDLAAVVNDAVATVIPAADAKAVRVETAIEPGALPISGDPERLQQVIWNLVSNAVKFTPSGGRVQVRVESVPSGLEVVVSDTGIGIAPAFLPHVFERFRQADSSPTREHGGLGLGLAIARHIVEMHGGTVQATSPGEGRGTTFRVRFPVGIARPPRAAEERRAPVEVERQPDLMPDLHGIRVLTIDDDQDALKMVREVLEFAGAEVETASSASEGLERLAASPVDVVLADIGMPLMDGFALVGAIRRLPDARLRAVPAAALTAYARAEDRARVLRSGFQMHLGKPIDPGELVAAVAALARRVPHH